MSSPLKEALERSGFGLGTSVFYFLIWNLM